MTVVAWDGTTLAADKRSYGSYIRTTTKLFRSGDYIVGMSGTSDRMGEFRSWFEEGRDPKTYPENKGCDVFMLAVHVSGRIEEYQTSGYPIRIEGGTATVGSGGLAAAVAMFLGCDARRAVEVACAFDVNCGNGIDTLRFE